MSKKLEKYINETITNIREDRKITRDLLEDALKWVIKDEARHKEIGIVLSKYVETLQRSNEQLVKLAGMMSKRSNNEGLSKKDMEDIYSAISSEED